MLSASGIGSGLDIDGLVTQLVAAERAPQENRLLRKERSITSDLSAFGSLKGALAALQSQLTALTSPATFTQRTVTSSSSAAVSATAGSTAATGSYNIEVHALASAQSLASSAFAAADTPVGEGTLTLSFGTATVSAGVGGDSVDAFVADAGRASIALDIDSSNNTLEGIRDTLNALDQGVTATIVNDAGGARLLFSATDTGIANSLNIDVSDSGDGNDTDALGLSRLAFNTGAAHLTQTVAAGNASYTLNGLSLSADSNQINDAIEGLNLQLKAVAGEPVQIRVTENRQAVTGAVATFVEAYNQFVGVANSLTRYDATSGTAGALQGDFSARAVVNQLRNLVRSDAGLGNDGINSLSQVGIQTQVDGTLKVNQELLNAALDADIDRVAAVFTAPEQGLATRLDDMLDSFLGSDGLLTSRTESLQAGIQSIADDKEALLRRMDAVETRYRSQFNALDTLLAQLENTGTFLTQQLESIPLPGQSSK